VCGGEILSPKPKPSLPLTLSLHTHFVFKINIEPPTSVLQIFFKGNQWLLVFREVNVKMAATFAAPAMKKRKEKREELEERIIILEEEVKELKKQLE